MPVKRDPFSVAIEEKLDYIRSAEAYARTLRNGDASSIIAFERQERTFASSDGAFYSQTVYNSLGNGSFFSVSTSDPVTHRVAGRGAQFVSPTGAGYEIFTDANLLEQIPHLYDQAREMLTATPLESPSRYDVVFDGYALAGIVNGSIGSALEIDRALGFEANAGGTSYLAPVEQIVGTRVAPPSVTVTANRSERGGAATVKWDDDGVPTRDFTLVKSGMVMDYASSREHAPTLAAWYQKQGQPVASNGCAASESAMTVPIVHPPNMELHPGASDKSFLDLVAEVEDGIAFLGGRVLIDQQQLNGEGLGEMAYRIKKGKLAGTLAGAAYLFRSPDLWKDLASLGGASTSVTRGIGDEKGQPLQRTVHSVTSVAAHFKNVRVIDVRADTSQAQQRLRFG
jgi:TldD protein